MRRGAIDGSPTRRKGSPVAALTHGESTAPVAGFLPLEPLASAAIETFSLQESVDFPWAAIVKLLIWTAIGLALALRFFSYEPSGVGHNSETETSAQLPTEIET